MVGAPQIAYPLRFISDIYKILSAKGEKDFIPKESITREQVGSEGYEGAIRNTLYKGEYIRERVIYINFPKREVFVAREWNNYISTKPKTSRFIIPNFNKDFRYRTIYLEMQRFIILASRNFITYMAIGRIIIRKKTMSDMSLMAKRRFLKYPPSIQQE